MSSPQVQWDEPTHQVQWDEPKKTTVPEPEKPGFLSSAWEDLKGLGKSIIMPQGVNPYPGMGVEQKQAIATGAREEDESRKAAGYGKGYRILAPIGEAVGVNVPGMEQSAKEGDVGGVLGHAAAVPIAIAAGHGISAAPEAVRAVGERVTPKRAAQAIGGVGGGVAGHGTLSAPGAYYGAKTAGKIAEGILGERANKPFIKPRNQAPAIEVYRDATLDQKNVPEFAGEEMPSKGIEVYRDATKENQPFAGEEVESKPSRGAPIERDATNLNEPYAGEEGAEPRSIPQQQNSKAIMYRTRDVGEQGVPHNPRARAQASESLSEVNDRLAPSRGDTTGNPQETVGIDLSRVPGFSVRPGPNGPNWIKFHGEASPGVSVPESAISKVGSEAPAISTQQLDSAESHLATKKGAGMIGDQVQQSLGNRPIQPNVPLRQQGKIPEGMTPHESSATQAHRYNPQTNELEIFSGDGKHYVYGEVSPEAAAKYEGAESKGKAWSEIKRNHPLVAKVLNGKRVSVKPATK